MSWNTHRCTCHIDYRCTRQGHDRAESERVMRAAMAEIVAVTGICVHCGEAAIDKADVLIPWWWTQQCWPCWSARNEVTT